jgi:hypothetical protein
MGGKSMFRRLPEKQDVVCIVTSLVMLMRDCQLRQFCVTRERVPLTDSTRRGCVYMWMICARDAETERNGKL